MDVVPFTFGTGVKVSVPFDATAGCVEKSDGSAATAEKVTACAGSFGPAETAFAQHLDESFAQRGAGDPDMHEDPHDCGSDERGEFPMHDAH